MPRRPINAPLLATAFAAALSTVLFSANVASGQSTAPSSAQPPVVARITGTAFDSVSMRPLAGATIQLIAANNPAMVRTATTAEGGRYTIDSVRVGTYLLGFYHPTLDSLGIEASLLRIDVRTSSEIQAPVAIPSGHTLVARVCGPTVANDSLGVFMGFVRAANGGPLSSPARVRAQWTQIVLGRTGISHTTPSVVATTTATGSFALCGLPVNGNFLARAFVGTDSSGFVEMEAPKRGLIYRDLYIGAARREAGATRDASVLRGSGALRGVVRNAKGQPVPNARLALWGSGREDTTLANGQFSLQTLPTGTYTLEARAIGYNPARVTVDMTDSTEVVRDIAMDVFVPTIDTMRVTATRNRAIEGMNGFEQRKKSGIGHFIDETQLEKRPSMFMSDVLRMTPNITVERGELSGDRVMMRGSASRGACVPTVYLNGVRTFTDDGNIDMIVNPQEVRAIEVYTRTGSIPPEFQGSNGCGSIVIWTGARKRTTP